MHKDIRVNYVYFDINYTKKKKNCKITVINSFFRVYATFPKILS